MHTGRPGIHRILLHGWPSSSHQYRTLIPALASRFHVIAPDYLGFGNSDAPDPKTFEYTFADLAAVIENFLERKGFRRFGLYIQDYGGPVGFRIITKNPQSLEWLIIQNANAYEVGFSEAWSGLRNALWVDRTPTNEEAVAGFLELNTVRTVYLTGSPVPELISPDNWNSDYRQTLGRPHGGSIQMDLFYDYRTNPALYPRWQAFLRERQPKTIIFWGQGDIFFTPAGGESFLKDIPKAEMHRLDAGHFAVEDCRDYIAETAKLSLAAELARDYFELRAADLQNNLLDETVAAYEKALHLTELRYTNGVAPRADLEQARTQLEGVRVQQTDVNQMRARYEHAIAVLIGKPPEDFQLPSVSSYQLHPPPVPLGVPGSLLERRSDVASAERRVAEANERIGIAKSAYFPSVVLGASAGFEGSSAKNWFVWPSRFWAVGPSIAETLFDGGRRRAASESALAGYDATVALYRLASLTAFQEVEDNLVALTVLGKEVGQQRNATEAARRSLALSTKRYNDGVDTYLQVVTSQTTSLQNERNEIDLRGQQMAASIFLIKALGGGWDASSLPKY